MDEWRQQLVVPWEELSKLTARGRHSALECTASELLCRSPLAPGQAGEVSLLYLFI